MGGNFVLDWRACFDVQNGKKVGGFLVWGLSQHFIGIRTVYSDKHGAIRYREKDGQTILVSGSPAK